MVAEAAAARGVRGAAVRSGAEQQEQLEAKLKEWSQLIHTREKPQNSMQPHRDILTNHWQPASTLHDFTSAQFQSHASLSCLHSKRFQRATSVSLIPSPPKWVVILNWNSNPARSDPRPCTTLPACPPWTCKVAPRLQFRATKSSME